MALVSLDHGASRVTVQESSAGPGLLEKTTAVNPSAVFENIEDKIDALEAIVATFVPFPENTVFISPSGDTTGTSDEQRVQEAIDLGKNIALLSAGGYYGKGEIDWTGYTGVILTTDERPAFWNQGSLASVEISALPCCVNRMTASIDVLLPPADNWINQQIAVETAGASVATAVAAAGETIGEVMTSLDVGGTDNRLVLQSQGGSVVIPISTGSPQSHSLYAESIISPYANLSFTPGRLADSSVSDALAERGNHEFVFGGQRGPTFTQGSAMFFKFAPTGANLVDIQTYGDTNASTVRYMRWAHSIGRRDQQTGVNQPWTIQPQASGAHIVVELGAGTATDFWVTAAGAAGAVNNIFVDGDGSVIIAAVATQELQLRSGATVRLEINGTGLGLFGVAPVARPSVSASSGTLALDLLVALNALGAVLQTA